MKTKEPTRANEGHGSSLGPAGARGRARRFLREVISTVFCVWLLCWLFVPDVILHLRLTDVGADHHRASRIQALEVELRLAETLPVSQRIQPRFAETLEQEIQDENQRDIEDRCMSRAILAPLQSSALHVFAPHVGPIPRVPECDGFAAHGGDDG